MGNIQMNTVTIRNAEDGMDYVTMKAAEGAVNSVTAEKNRYCGYGYPYFFRVKSASPDKSWSMYYLSPSRYREDYNTDRKDFARDLYGVLYRKFMTADQYIEFCAKTDLKNIAEVTLEKKIPFVSNDRLLKENGPKKEKAAKDKDMVLKRYYYCGMVHHYSYEYQGRKRMRAYSAVVEGEDLEAIGRLPSSITASFGNPFMQDLARMALASFPNARCDEKEGWIYSLMHYLDWRVTQKFVLDAPAETFEALYQQVFLPTLNKGVVISEAVWAEFRAKQAEINQSNQAKREQAEAEKQEQRKQQKIQQAKDEERRKRRQDLQDYLRNTQKEISDIRKSAWENTQKTNAKVNEMWGDTLRGDTRFVDKYGDEHVIHTYDKYAYKSGDTYVTSDSPLEHGWDWEELEKKKY